MWMIGVGAAEGESGVDRFHSFKITGSTRILGAVRCGGTKCYRPFPLVTLDAG